VTAVQLFQLYCGYFLLRMLVTNREWRQEWCIWLASALFFVLAIGNIVATNKVYFFKWRDYRRRRATVTKEHPM
jgi:Ni/Fe-hydrogenase subunit HybB-like protein